MAFIKLLSIQGIRAFDPLEEAVSASQGAQLVSISGCVQLACEDCSQNGRAPSCLAPFVVLRPMCHPQLIKFDKPLTVIVGENGCGKTVSGSCV